MKSSAMKKLPLLAPLPATPYELAEWKASHRSVQLSHILCRNATPSSTRVSPHEISNAKLMFELQIKTIEISYTIIGLHPTVVFTGTQGTIQYNHRAHATFTPAVP